jgi:prevent-host-death family protein
MTKIVGHNTVVESYNVAEAKTHLSEILERVSEGEEILLTRRGKPVARVIPAAHAGGSILGAGRQDPNINFDVLAGDEWWKPVPDDESASWYE